MKRLFLLLISVVLVTTLWSQVPMRRLNYGLYIPTIVADTLAADSVKLGTTWFRTPADGVLDWTGYKYAPYAAKGAGKFDVGGITPSNTTRLNYDGQLWVYDLYSPHNVTSYSSTDSTVVLPGRLRVTVSGTARTYLDPRAVNGSSAVAYMFDTHNQLTIAGAKLASLKNQNVEKLYVTYDGSLISSNGSIYPIKGVSSNATTSSAGVYGAGNAGYGVQGLSNSGVGGVFTSTSGEGLVASSNSNNALRVWGKTGRTIYADVQSSSSNTSDVISIARVLTGTADATGNYFSAFENSSTSGTVSGSLLIGTFFSTVRTNFNPLVVNGGSAVAYMFDTHNALTTTAKLLSLKNQGAEKFYIQQDGAVQAANYACGVDTVRNVQTKNVATLGLLRADAAGTLNGFTGGRTGQTLSIVNTTVTTLVLKHNGSGAQKIMITGAADLTMDAQYDAVTLIFDGTYWFVTGKNF